MNRTQISNLLRYRTGKTVKQLAIENGYTKQTYYRIISGEIGKSPIYQIISDVTGKPLFELWPDKFKEQNKPRTDLRKGQKNTSAPAGRSTPIVGDVGRTSEPSRG